MAGPEFFQTQMGMRFIEGTMPSIMRYLGQIAEEMKRANDLKENEIQEKEGEGR